MANMRALEMGKVLTMKFGPAQTTRTSTGSECGTVREQMAEWPEPYEKPQYRCGTIPPEEALQRPNCYKCNKCGLCACADRTRVRITANPTGGSNRERYAPYCPASTREQQRSRENDRGKSESDKMKGRDIATAILRSVGSGGPTSNEKCPAHEGRAGGAVHSAGSETARCKCCTGACLTCTADDGACARVCEGQRINAIRRAANDAQASEGQRLEMGTTPLIKLVQTPLAQLLMEECLWNEIIPAEAVSKSIRMGFIVRRHTRSGRSVIGRV